MNPLAPKTRGAWMPLLICPVWCGFTASGDDADQQLSVHLTSCPRGVAYLERMRLFTVWLIDTIGATVDLDTLPAPYAGCATISECPKTGAGFRGSDVRRGRRSSWCCVGALRLNSLS